MPDGAAFVADAMSANQGLHVELISDRERIPLTRGQWNSLVGANQVSTVFQSYEWFDSWWSTFGESGRLAFLAVNSGEQVVGFAALMTKRALPGFTRLQFVGTGNADYQDVIAPPDIKRAVVAAICQFLQGPGLAWTRLWLCNVPEHSDTLAYLRADGATYGLRLIREAVEPCPALVIDGEREAVQRQIGKYSIRRPLNWFQKRGTVRFRKLTDWLEIERQLPVFFEQHIQRWAETGQASLFFQDGQRRFYRTLAKAFLEAGWLSFSIVEFDDKPLAFHFGFDDGRILTWYKPSFDVSYSQHSPGLLLIRHLIEDALQNGRSEMDFTIGGEQFKDRFANRKRQNLYLSVYRSGAMWRLALFVKFVRRAMGTGFRRFR